MLPLILASASARRHELLTAMRIAYEVIIPDVDEHETGAPAELVQMLAKKKALAVSAEHPGRFILAADTLVAHRGQVFGKPQDAKEAASMIAALQDDWHEVFSGICLITPDGVQDVNYCCTKVHFVPLSEQDIAAYVASGEPMGKAGAYAIQGLAGMYVSEIEGCYANVIGLPTALVRQMLLANGYPLHY